MDHQFAWKEWVKKNVGAGKVIEGMAVLQRPPPGQAITKADVKRLLWTTCGVWKAKTSELANILQLIESKELHKGVVKLNDVPFIATHVDYQEWVLRSLAQGGGLLVRTNQTMIVIAIYRDDDSRSSQRVAQFCHHYLGNAQRAEAMALD
ncbi:hypothetical protein HOP50_14g71360 [Chloropicon primus]|uniref:Profilin n=1 Tax=Chloropicon primus TaxID=1764295 RepID=A0A5B8MUX0_9CHLO|nr:hypothetical protein A3770_14p71160 [Chloropicon primus]UPR03806.1 hypothetical protein HOP50_14g71360 [Chloropicon primus]|mmetsp:Transcript_5121/g.15404  ORF Transcript_5121/g.15404 Transcript_5121/m.15404 type:complete len:150 (+) Transcript_5121:64-513(+)|eukprot:QDZ24598.1 hypothetical protein A3770_14p71160 [Chloropicon primus]